MFVLIVLLLTGFFQHHL